MQGCFPQQKQGKTKCADIPLNVRRPFVAIYCCLKEEHKLTGCNSVFFSCVSGDISLIDRASFNTCLVTFSYLKILLFITYPYEKAQLRKYCVENGLTRECGGQGKGSTTFSGNSLEEMSIRLRPQCGYKWKKLTYKWAFNFHYVYCIIKASADMLFMTYLYVYIKE